MRDDRPSVASTSCQILIATPFGDVGRQAGGLSVSSLVTYTKIRSPTALQVEFWPKDLFQTRR